MAFLLSEGNEIPSEDLDTLDLPSIIPAALLALVEQVEAAQPALRGHGRRTAMYADILGRYVGFSGRAWLHLVQAAFLHDIGKALLPPELLHHDRPLSADDYATFQSHPRHALSLLASWPSLLTPAIWIAHHHERWDGAGYPYGLRGEHIPLASRVIAIADAFDQLCMQTRQAAPSGWTLALRLLRSSAHSQFDPQLLEQFCRLPHPIPVPVDGLPFGMSSMLTGKRPT